MLCTPKAYIDFYSFETWSKFFVKNSKFNQERYSLLVYDMHSTHTSHLKAVKLLNKNKIIAVYSPSHSSHLFNIGDIFQFSQNSNNLGKEI